MEKRGKLALKNGKHNIYLLGGSSLLNDVGSEMIVQILPFFITSLGGGGAVIGALSGLREGLASLFKLIGGWYSDRIGKRMPFVFLGYFISIVSRFLLVFAGSWQMVIALVSAERLGKTRDAPRDVIIAESTKKRGKGFGIHQMFDTIGGIIGAALVLLLFWRFSLEFKTVILIAGAISALSLIPLFFVREIADRPGKKNLFEGIRNLKKSLKYFIFVSSVFTLANFGLYMFLLLRAKEVTGSIVIAMALGVLFNLVWASLSVPFGSLSDRLGRKRVLLWGYVLFFIVAIGFTSATSLLSLIPLFAAYGLVSAITQGNQRALVSDLSGNMKGTAMGFYQFVIGFVSIIGGITAGLLWDISPNMMFGYLALVAFISVLLLAFVREKNTD